MPPLALYKDAHKRVFFEPRAGTLRLFDRFNAKVKELVAEWWDSIENSRAFSANLAEIQAYHRTLRPGDITLVGLIAEGGQGMRRAGPSHLRPSAQGLLLADFGDCLEIIEKAVNWEAEKLYGVEGFRPFDEF